MKRKITIKSWPLPAQIAYISLSKKIDDCTDYLKENETPAECIARNRKDVSGVLKLLVKEKQRTEKLEAQVASFHRQIKALDALRTDMIRQYEDRIADLQESKP